jgi:hypothetical protein
MRILLFDVITMNENEMEAVVRVKVYRIYVIHHPSDLNGRALEMDLISREIMLLVGPLANLHRPSGRFIGCTSG